MTSSLPIPRWMCATQQERLWILRCLLTLKQFIVQHSASLIHSVVSWYVRGRLNGPATIQSTFYKGFEVGILQRSCYPFLIIDLLVYCGKGQEALAKHQALQKRAVAVRTLVLCSVSTWRDKYVDLHNTSSIVSTFTRRAERHGSVPCTFVEGLAQASFASIARSTSLNWRGMTLVNECSLFIEHSSGTYLQCGTVGVNLIVIVADRP